jgi:hypothetical protein
MNKKSGATKSQKQHPAKALEQLDSWIQKETNVTLLILAAPVALMLRGRVLVRMEGLFLFETHGGVCRMPIIPEHYDQVLWNKPDPGSVTLKCTSGELRLAADVREWVGA